MHNVVTDTKSDAVPTADELLKALRNHFITRLYEWKEREKQEMNREAHVRISAIVFQESLYMFPIYT